MGRLLARSLFFISLLSAIALGQIGGGGIGGSNGGGIGKGGISGSGGGNTPPPVGVTVTLAESTIINSSPLKIGTSVGSSTYYDSGQLYKNLLYTVNPGFEGFIEQQIIGCISGSLTTCVNFNQFDQAPSGYWNGATAYFCCSASGTSTNQGLTRTITTSTAASGGSGPTYTFNSSLSQAVGVDDYFSVALTVNSVEGLRLLALR